MGTSRDVPQANRDGYLSDEQLGTLTQDRQVRIAICLMFVIPFALIALWPPPPFTPVVRIVFLCLILGVVSWGVWSCNRYTRDIVTRKVAMVSGPVRLAIEGGGGEGTNHPEYALTVEGVRFKIDKDTLLWLKNGERYCVYYAPTTRKFLAAESLEDSAPVYETKRKRDEPLRLGDDGELIVEEKAKRSGDLS